MITTTRSLSDLTAGDLMSRDVITIPAQMSLQEAAQLLRRAEITGAPVVDESGVCIGVLSAVDFLRWTEEGSSRTGTRRVPGCRYQTRGRLLSGEVATICILEEGACPLQWMQPTTGGRHTAICLLSPDIPSDQPAPEEGGAGEVTRHMTRDIVTATLSTRLPELARRMLDAHIHRVVIIDELGRPIGIVSATDVLAAVACEETAFAGHGASQPRWSDHR
jgi:CBS-domain-containing membrane protein